MFGAPSAIGQVRVLSGALQRRRRASSSASSTQKQESDSGLVGSLLSRDIQIERTSFSDGVKQRLQLRWRGHFRPRPPKAPEHYPRVQPAPHLPQCHRPGRRSFLLFFLFGVLFFFPPPALQRVGSVVPDL